MIFDRALTPELLDVALRVATTAGASPDSRRLLTVALRDYVNDQEAQGKTKKDLSRIWVRPPAPARAMIAWAIENQHLDPEHTILHLGAILATFPFAGVVAAIAGRQLQLEGQIDARAVRFQTRGTLGDRSSIDVGARKVVTSLRYLGLIERSSSGLLVLGRQPAVPDGLQGWITHALLLTRQAEEIGTDEASRAPELATVKVLPGVTSDYPLLELHTEPGRNVAVPADAFGFCEPQAARFEHEGDESYPRRLF